MTRELRTERRGPRFRVTELEGWPIKQTTNRKFSGIQPGLSVQVIDTLNCYRIIQSWRTEEYGYGGATGGGLTHAKRREDIRRFARELADRLNTSDRQHEDAA